MISGRIDQTYPSRGAWVSSGPGPTIGACPASFRWATPLTIDRAGYGVAPRPVIMAGWDRSTSETRELPSVRSTLRRMACFVALLPPLAGAADDEAEELWVLKPVVRPEVSAGRTASSNPIDAFIAAEYEAEGPEAGRPGRQADAAPPRLLST